MVCWNLKVFEDAKGAMTSDSRRNFRIRLSNTNTHTYARVNLELIITGEINHWHQRLVRVLCHTFVPHPLVPVVRAKKEQETPSPVPRLPLPRRHNSQHYLSLLRTLKVYLKKHSRITNPRSLDCKSLSLLALHTHPARKEARVKLFDVFS